MENEAMSEILQRFLDQFGVQLNGTNPYDIHIVDPRMYQLRLSEPSLIAGETYMEGWWECDRLDELFFRIGRTQSQKSYYPWWSTTSHAIKSLLLNLQSRKRSKEVAERHYNLGNDLYEAMLGPTMAYTCGYWKDTDTLEQAQENKFDLICRKLQLKPGERLLDLGCGWGSFAKFAAERYGCEVVGVNISSEQVHYAQELCSKLPITICLADYRDVKTYNPHNQLFDKVASIGQFEHVGNRNYPLFFGIVKNLLKDSGLFLLHTIGKNVTSSFVDPWIHKYIFPYGMLPSIVQLAHALEPHFILEDLHNFGADYDKTLMTWHANFIAHWPQLASKFDDRFYRMWTYYLLSCAGGFRARECSFGS